jgi:adenylate cyclase
MIISLLLMASLFTVLSNFGFDRFSFPFYDLLQRSFSKKQNDEIVLIVVDQESIDAMSNADGVNFPWPRQYYGALAEVASELKAKALFFDIIFSEPSSYGNSDDIFFSDLLKKSKLPIFLNSTSYSHSIKKPIEIIEKASTRLGAVNISPSSDGVYRKVPEFIDSDKKVKTIPYVISEYFNHRNNKKEYIEYYSNDFITIPFYNIIREYRLLQKDYPLSEFTEKLKNKIWIIGYSAPGLYDLRPSSINNKSTGMFILASSLTNRLQDQGLREVSLIEISLLTLISIILIFYSARLFKRPFYTVIFFLSSIVILTITFSVMLWPLSIWYNPFPLMNFLFLLGLVFLYYRFKSEWQERLRVEKGLAKSMSKEMLKLVKHGDISSFRFHNEKEVTILFADIVSFTTISETISPNDLVKILDFYYDEIVKLIFKNKGYVDKFIGDAVMAVWGAPAPLETHAKMGVDTAIEYAAAVAKVNVQIKNLNANLPLLKARVGLHTGKVLAGNIGSSQRFNYTVIGDAVNLASRLESIGKSYNCTILISEETYNESKIEHDKNILLVDEIIVKGKSEPTKILTYLNSEEFEFKENYQKAFSLYQNEEYTEALSYFQQVKKFGPAKIMSKRCEDIINNGCPNNLSKGVWSHDEK